MHKEICQLCMHCVSLGLINLRKIDMLSQPNGTGYYSRSFKVRNSMQHRLWLNFRRTNKFRGATHAVTVKMFR